MGSLQGRVALVTGGSRGLGKAMAWALAEQGCTVVAAGHLAEDRFAFEQAARSQGLSDRLDFFQVDLRSSSGCDALVAHARQHTGHVDILVNNAGLTLTFVAPDLYTRQTPRRFYESSDEVIRGIYETNCMAPEMIAARVAPAMVERGWGRILNVTTMQPTMQRPGFCPYGSSKAALEMASMVWAQELEGTGVTVNVLNPGGGANTQGIAQEVREASARGDMPRLVEPDDMVPPLLWLVSSHADQTNGRRFDANAWDVTLSAEQIAQQPGWPCGLQTLQPLVWFGVQIVSSNLISAA